MRGLLHRLFREPAPLPIGSNPPPQRRAGELLEAMVAFARAAGLERAA